MSSDALLMSVDAKSGGRAVSAGSPVTEGFLGGFFLQVRFEACSVEIGDCVPVGFNLKLGKGGELVHT